ncbi:MAG TPA: IPT/TIG domain-containing protein, partial [Candidatus Acidoferrales bacterium]|nr:IPT/TIG domain-containing protein [Candidatus Acidoferrales bacterium]
MAGSAPLVLTVSGSGFEGDTYLLIDGSAQPPQSQTPTQLQTTIPSSELATAGSITISVANLAPTAGPSNQVTFTVTPLTSNPAPTLASALDSSVPAGWP